MTISFKKDIIPLTVLLLVVVVITLIVYPKFASIGTDGVFYALMAQNLAAGEGLSVFGKPQLYFSPLFSIVTVPFYWLLSDIDLSAHVSMIFWGLCSLILFYFIGLSLEQRPVALLGTLFLACNGPWIWRNSLRPTAQALAGFLSLVILSLLLGLIRIRDKTSNAAFVVYASLGVISGAAYLTRPEYFFFIIPISIFVWAINRGSMSWKKNIATIGVVIAFFLLVAGPYIIFLRQHTGYWTFSGRIAEQYLVSTHASEIAAATPVNLPELQSNPLLLIVKSLSSFIKLYFDNLLGIERSLVRVLGFIGIAFYVLGLRSYILQKRFKELGAILVPTSLILALALGHTGDNGYITPFLFFFIIFIAIGCHEFATDIGRLFRGHYARIVVLGGLSSLIVLYFIFPVVQNLAFQPDGYKPLEYQMLGAWFKNNVLNSTRQIIVARKPEIPFYAGAGWREISGQEPLEDILSMMRENGLLYIVIDRSLENTAPHLLAAAKDQRIPDGALLKQFDFAGHVAYLYKIGK